MDQKWSLLNNSTFAYSSIFIALNAQLMAKKAINRIKVVLVEQGRTNKWLAGKLGKNAATVSRWCTNDMQPSLETLVQISEVLNVNVRELIVGNK
jgi:transcriptional regulator with XRE-family HTH domain